MDATTATTITAAIDRHPEIVDAGAREVNPAILLRDVPLATAYLSDRKVSAGVAQDRGYGFATEGWARGLAGERSKTVEDAEDNSTTTWSRDHDAEVVARFPVTPEQIAAHGALVVRLSTLNEDAQVIDAGFQLRQLSDNKLTPWTNKNGKQLGKFVGEIGRASDFYIHPMNASAVLSPTTPKLLIEGSVNADAILSVVGYDKIGVIAAHGVTMPTESRGAGVVGIATGSMLARLPDIVEGTDWYVAFDGDAHDNEMVARSLEGVAVVLGDKARSVRFLDLPRTELPDGTTAPASLDELLAASEDAAARLKQLMKDAKRWDKMREALVKSGTLTKGRGPRAARDWFVSEAMMELAEAVPALFNYQLGQRDQRASISAAGRRIVSGLDEVTAWDEPGIEIVGQLGRVTWDDNGIPGIDSLTRVGLDMLRETWPTVEWTARGRLGLDQIVARITAISAEAVREAMLSAAMAQPGELVEADEGRDTGVMIVGEDAGLIHIPGPIQRLVWALGAAEDTTAANIIEEIVSRAGYTGALGDRYWAEAEASHTPPTPIVIDSSPLAAETTMLSVDKAAPVFGLYLERKLPDGSVKQSDLSQSFAYASRVIRSENLQPDGSTVDTAKEPMMELTVVTSQRKRVQFTKPVPLSLLDDAKRLAKYVRAQKVSGFLPVVGQEATGKVLRASMRLSDEAPTTVSLDSSGWHQAEDGVVGFATPSGTVRGRACGLASANVELSDEAVAVRRSKSRDPVVGSSFAGDEDARSAIRQMLTELLATTTHHDAVALVWGATWGAPVAAGITPRVPASTIEGPMGGGKTSFIEAVLNVTLGHRDSQLVIDMSRSSEAGSRGRAANLGQLPLFFDDARADDRAGVGGVRTSRKVAAAGEAIAEDVVSSQYGLEGVARANQDGTDRGDSRPTGLGIFAAEVLEMTGSRDERSLYAHTPRHFFDKAKLDAWVAKWSAVGPELYWAKVASNAAYATERGGTSALRDALQARVSEIGYTDRASQNRAMLKAMCDLSVTILGVDDVPAEAFSRSVWEGIDEALSENAEERAERGDLGKALLSAIGEKAASGDYFIDVSAYAGTVPVAAMPSFGYTQGRDGWEQPRGKGALLGRLSPDAKFIVVERAAVENVVRATDRSVSVKQAAERLAPLAEPNTGISRSSAISQKYTGSAKQLRAFAFKVALCGLDLVVVDSVAAMQASPAAPVS